MTVEVVTAPLESVTDVYDDYLRYTDVDYPSFWYV